MYSFILKFWRLLISLVTVCIWISSFTHTLYAATNKPSDIYALINIDQIGSEKLTEIQLNSDLVWWVEIDDQLLILASEDVASELTKNFEVQVLQVPVFKHRLYFLREYHRVHLFPIDADVLATGGRFAVIQSWSDKDPDCEIGPEDYQSLSGGSSLSCGGNLLPFLPHVVLARQSANNPPSEAKFIPFLQDIIDQVDDQEWFDDITVLASFNRYTRSTDINNARDWLVQRLKRIGVLDVTTESFSVGSTVAYNVIGTLDGTERSDDWYIIGGHYDAFSEDPFVAAPGAEDNASGCAGVLALSRIFARYITEGSVIFICFSGEEQGLLGSTHHASRLVSSTNDSKVKAFINMDMIGFTEDADLDCLLETDQAFSSLAMMLSDSAATYTSLRIVTSFYPSGSDHVPFIKRGIPAVLTIENDWSSYPYYHRTTDLPDNISLDMGREILRMNTAAMAQMIFGTSIPALRGDLNDDRRVDSQDMFRLLRRLGDNAEKGDPADIDQDGLITVLDARKLVLFCTRTGCVR